MPHPTFNITVNKKPVPVSENKMTGLEIKKAAIETGLQIELDFQLKIERGHGEWDGVGNDKVVTVNKNSVFRAVAADDNS